MSPARASPPSEPGAARPPGAPLALCWGRPGPTRAGPLALPARMEASRRPWATATATADCGGKEPALAGPSPGGDDLALDLPTVPQPGQGLHHPLRRHVAHDGLVQATPIDPRLG
jgi:hypothetical protein